MGLALTGLVVLGLIQSATSAYAQPGQCNAASSNTLEAYAINGGWGYTIEIPSRSRITFTLRLLRRGTSQTGSISGVTLTNRFGRSFANVKYALADASYAAGWRISGLANIQVAGLT
ncbi:MAG TPA: hypothetical protein VK816_00625 [Jatrophihabitantaceae bacterium]|nr:hypothetical protein [Jatrophihabitantaceae bacterium]